MNCAKCGQKLLLAHRICPKCKFLAEGNRVVNVAPRRARRRRVSPGVPPVASWRVIWRMGKDDNPRPPRLLPALRFMSKGLQIAGGIIPGLGHILSGRAMWGAAALIVIGGLWTLGAYNINRGGQVMIGLAAALHAYSLCDLMPIPREGAFVKRMIAIGLMLGLLQSYAYWPAAERLNRAVNGNPAPRRAYAHGYPTVDIGVGLEGGEVAMALLIASFLIFVVAFIFRAALQDWINNRKKPGAPAPEKNQPAIPESNRFRWIPAFARRWRRSP